MHPASAVQSPLAYYGHDPATPGLPSNPRMQLLRLWLRLSTYLDYWTGAYTTLPGDACLEAPLSPAHHVIFPQLLVSSDLPRMLLVRGSEGSAVSANSSREMHTRLRAAKVETVLRIADGSGRSFDLKDDAEATSGGLFDEAVEFLGVNPTVGGNGDPRV